LFDLYSFAAGLLTFDELSMLALAILATMLAATDAALGKAVITNIVSNADLPGAQFMSMVVVFTVFLSAIAHGVTANPLASAMAARVA
jgi:hypothetical protein